jgi:hypothetical protein
MSSHLFIVYGRVPQVISATLEGTVFPDLLEKGNEEGEGSLFQYFKDLR